MWNQGSYGGGYGDGGGGGFGSTQGGGGFMNSPGGFSSPMQGSQEKSRGRRAQNLMPVTVAELINLTDDELKIGDIEVSMVTVVGLVRSVQQAPTNILYKLDDMSGPTMDVRKWVDSDDSSGDVDGAQPIPENTYVRVIGQLRSFGGKRNISAFKVRPLTDLNELTMHLLEVVHSHMYIEKAQTEETAIQSCHDDTGISIDVIGQRLRGMSKDAIRNAVEFLSNEGHIYSTIDDDHFKSTDS
uniref:Replication protein A 32 kDa subunit-like n=1 Tax=Saccoglossus kowalevskii TaxID=10224 RepID=A0ABM0GZI4_SACKO|nr:PREDICTED: replication protein A 32 kDa subunit-like [Saccoglossus kowalevskii]